MLPCTQGHEEALTHYIKVAPMSHWLILAVTLFAKKRTGQKRRRRRRRRKVKKVRNNLDGKRSKRCFLSLDMVP
jgi:hypothetical protein